MTDLVQLALSLTALAGTAAEVVKKHEFHGHILDKDRLRRTIVQIIATCEQITEAIDDSAELE